ncbi:hypothetical protein [Pseudonocardia adelaidensis]|uniref:Uncharacterized protein n=1 Tax=Pseudonocardia adelaidensis TaxID=648754 RepID=A0ABP9P1R2_9PSEU
MDQDQDEWIRELLRRRDVEDRDLAAAEKRHKERTDAIDVLLRAAGWINGAHVDGPRKKTTVMVDANVLVVANRTTRDYVKRALADAGKPMKMSDVVDAVKDLGAPASEVTVRTVLAKMLKAGQITRPERGMYGLPEQPAGPDPEVAHFLEKVEERAKETPEDNED